MRHVSYSLGCVFVLAAACAPVEGDDVAETTDDVILRVRSDECLFGATSVALRRNTRAFTFGPEARLAGRSPLTPVQQAQLSSIIDGAATPAAAYAAMQDGEVFVRAMTERASGRTFTYYRYYAGDNEHGALFLADSAARAAVVGDQSLYQCAVTPQRALPAGAECLFGVNTQALDESGRFAVAAPRTLTARTRVDALTLQQLRLLAGGAARTYAEVLAATDEGVVTVEVLTERATRRRFQRYTTVRGDHYAGLTFAYGSLDAVVAQLDVDHRACLLPAPVAR